MVDLFFIELALENCKLKCYNEYNADKLTIPILHFSRHKQMYEARVKIIIEMLPVSNFYGRCTNITLTT